MEPAEACFRELAIQPANRERSTSTWLALNKLQVEGFRRAR